MKQHNKGIITSLFISALIGIIIIPIWLYAAKSFAFLLEIVNSSNTEFHWWKGVFLIAVAVLFGFLAEKISVKRLVLYVVSFIFLWFIVSVAANTFFNISLLFVPMSLTILLTISVVHLKKLWLIDAELTEKLLTLASSGHLLELKSADLAH